MRVAKENNKNISKALLNFQKYTDPMSKENKVKYCTTLDCQTFINFLQPLIQKHSSKNISGMMINT